MSILQRPTGTDDLGCTQSPELFAKPARFRAVGAVVAVLALGVIVVAVLALGVIVGAQANAQGSADFNQAQVLAQELAQAGPGGGAGSGGAQTGQPSAPAVRPPSSGDRSYPQGSDPQVDGQDDAEVPIGPGCRDRNEPLSLLV